METPLNVSWKSAERPLDTRPPTGPRRLAGLRPKHRLSTMRTVRQHFSSFPHAQTGTIRA